MIARECRLEIEAGLEGGMTERRIGGSDLPVVTVRLRDDGADQVSDELGAPVIGPLVVSCRRLSAARELAFCLLELAERLTRTGMSQGEASCNQLVAVRRVLGPFAGLWRGDLTCSTPEIRTGW